MESALGTPQQPIPPRRTFGVRLWLALAFAAVGIATATALYFLVSASSEQAAQGLGTEIAVGRTFRIADRLESAPAGEAESIVSTFISEDFRAWAFDARGKLLSAAEVSGMEVAEIRASEGAVDTALAGRRYTEQGTGTARVTAEPVVREGEVGGAVLTRSSRPAELREAIDSLREDRFKALGIAVGVAILFGIVIASLFSVRLKRLAGGAAQLARGRLDVPLEARGRDEVGDVGRALETMRIALRESFELLSTERDTLSAILGALSEAVLVVTKDRDVRFSNPAAAPVIGPDGRVSEALAPWLRRAEHRGEARNDALRIGGRVYALHATDLPAEGAILVVVRDRTEELRRELAEREFVSNAAHELRNPIAGISGSIEVLLSGAKDDPEAREHFLRRLAGDAERISRLTHALLTLARVDAGGQGEVGVVDVALAAEEAAQAVAPPDGLELSLNVQPGLGVQGDPALVRQVLISLLTNAYKHTPAEGVVTLRARDWAGGDAVIEVSDTGDGIPEEEQDRIFDRFYRGSNAIEKEGFGLGLSIARRMVEVMDGEIGVHSRSGHGSTFWVRLRAAHPAPTPVA